VFLNRVLLPQGEKAPSVAAQCAIVGRGAKLRRWAFNHRLAGAARYRQRGRRPLTQPLKGSYGLQTSYESDRMVNSTMTSARSASPSLRPLVANNSSACHAAYARRGGRRNAVERRKSSDHASESEGTKPFCSFETGSLPRFWAEGDSAK
jgi:hypothetical protein